MKAGIRIGPRVEALLLEANTVAGIDCEVEDLRKR